MILKILSQATDKKSLPLLESIFVKGLLLKPNSDTDIK